jgi:CubicO group peptidase (beta-lactamase class C family)
MIKFQIIIILLIASLSQAKGVSYQHLLTYEGKYQYIGDNTLTFVASELDNKLYAVINKAKYPLKYQDVDSFLDVVNNPVIFQRNSEGKVVSYQSAGSTYKILSREFIRLEMLPRRQLFKQSEKYVYQQPIEVGDGIKVNNLNNVFKKPELIEQMVKETIKGSYPEVHSILIYKGSALVVEEYFYGYNRNTPHQLRSATKPFIGSLVGIAIEKSFLKSELEPILPYFKSAYKQIKNLNTLKQQQTIENYLTYQHGMDCDNNNSNSKGNETAMMESADWVKHTLDLPMKQAPGQASLYCTGVALSLGKLVEISSNMKIEDFADKNLFKPLGINNYTWRFDPDKSSSQTFSQMSITPRGLLKLALMYKNEGKWQGQQILAKTWIDKTFNKYGGEFGYLWKHKYFIVDGKRYDSYMASGNGGQKINIWPQLDMITVFTGGNYNSYQLYGKSTAPNEMIPNYILKAL